MHRRKIRKTTQSLFRKQEKEVLHALEAARPTKGDMVLSTFFDLMQWTLFFEDGLQSDMTNVFQAGLAAGFQRIDIEIEAVDFTSDIEQVAESVGRSISQSNLINQTTQKELQEAINAIQQGLVEGDSWDAMRQSVRKIFKDAKGYRADAIAETAATAGFERGQLEAFQEAGMDARRWLTQRDSNVRASHQALDGEIAKLDEDFSNGLRYPGDPNGPVGEVIRCRCTTLPLLNEDIPDDAK